MAIVFGTDFSAPAGAAAEVAVTLAARRAGTLELVHVVDEAALSAADELRPGLMAAAERRLQQEAARLEALGGRVHAHLLSGAPDEALLGFATSLGAELLALATRGQRSLGDRLLGTVTDRVVRRATMPVLALREVAGLLAWLDGQRPLRVLAGASRDATGLAALAWLARLRRFGPCDLTVVQSYWPPDEHARLGVAYPMDLVTPHPVVEAALIRDLMAQVGPLPGEGALHFKAVPGWGRVDAFLLQAAAALAADVIVVGSHQRRGADRLWHGSVSYGVLHDAPTAVACVPLACGPAPAAVAPPRHVLVATDLSPAGNLAVPHAYALLGAGAEVQLCVVMRVAAPDAERAAAQEALLALVPPDAAARGVATRAVVVEDEDPAAAIRQLAARQGAELIALGSHGRSGLEGALLGSVAQALLADAPAPLLVVRPPRD